MAIPTRTPGEELAPPPWLRDYTSIEVDIRGMAEHAAMLRTELEASYTPHREQVNRDMITQFPAPDERFVELCQTLDRHFTGRLIATSLLTEHGNASGMLAATAGAISLRHHATDGLAQTRTQDVRAMLAAGAPSGGDPSVGEGSA